LCRSAAETRAFAASLAKKLRGGEIFLLTGPLGVGKTEFVKGLARGLGVRNPDAVTSPTFVLAQSFKARRGLVLHHLDLYRLEGVREFYGAGLDELLADPRAVKAVEWGEKMPAALRKGALEVCIAVLKSGERKISLRHA
jgi:tRNA threonylcarbamoyladenosine biosynthesis protein TsaE